MDKDKMMRTNVLIEHIREYDGNVDYFYKKIYTQFEKYIEQEYKVLDTQIFQDMQRDFANLVSFIDKRNTHEASLIARLFGDDQNKRRALQYFFTGNWDEGNRFLHGHETECLEKSPHCAYTVRKAIKELQDLPQE